MRRDNIFRVLRSDVLNEGKNNYDNRRHFYGEIIWSSTQGYDVKLDDLIAEH